MELKLKEKDQEVKLHELKVRELKKAIPHTRLRPLKGRHKTVDHTSDELFKMKIFQKVKPRVKNDELYQDTSYQQVY